MTLIIPHGQNGLVVTMDYNGKVIYTADEFNRYKRKLVDKIFAILGIYEDCQDSNDYSSYNNYVERVKIELIGFSRRSENIELITIVNLLAGIQDSETINHKTVKSLVFHIISMIQNLEV